MIPHPLNPFCDPQDKNSVSLPRAVSAFSVPAPFEIKPRIPTTNVYLAAHLPMMMVNKKTMSSQKKKKGEAESNTEAEAAAAAAAAVVSSSSTSSLMSSTSYPNSKKLTKQAMAHAFATFKPTAQILVVRHPAYLLHTAANKVVGWCF